MINKKITDNEIKSALKGAILNAKGYDSKVWSIEVYKLQNALDLIDRQKAEIERLQKEQDLFADIGKMYSEIKAEAVKEFAENAIERVEKAKLKYQRLCEEQGEEMEEYMRIHFNGIIGIINNLLKESVGDADGFSNRT